MNDRSLKAVRLPPSAATEGTRRRILQGALALFATRGFHGSSLRDLAGVVELQASAIYGHFPSKEHILAELARIGHEVHHDAIRAALLEAGNDPAEQLSALAKAHARIHAQYSHLAIVVNDEIRALTSELSAPALALRKQSVAVLMQILERGQRMRRFRCPRLEIVAAAIGAMGLRIPYWYSADSGIDIEALAEAHAELALRLVGAER